LSFFFVFNCDKTGLYCKLEPRKTLAHGPVSEKKDRVSLFVTYNAVEFIRNSRAMRGIGKKLVPSQHGCNGQFLLVISSHKTDNLEQSNVR